MHHIYILKASCLPAYGCFYIPTDCKVQLHLMELEVEDVVFTSVVEACSQQQFTYKLEKGVRWITCGFNFLFS